MLNLDLFTLRFDLNIRTIIITSSHSKNYDRVLKIGQDSDRDEF